MEHRDDGNYTIEEQTAMMGKKKQPSAKEIWKLVESNLNDRGCFNGIDDETMRDLRREQIQSIAALIGED